MGSAEDLAAGAGEGGAESGGVHDSFIVDDGPQPSTAAVPEAAGAAAGGVREAVRAIPPRHRPQPPIQPGATPRGRSAAADLVLFKRVALLIGNCHTKQVCSSNMSGVATSICVSSGVIEAVVTPSQSHLLDSPDVGSISISLSLAGLTLPGLQQAERRLTANLNYRTIWLVTSNVS